MLGLKLNVRMARGLAAFLAGTEFDSIAVELKTKLEECDRRQREARERRAREKAFLEAQRLNKEACNREGHPQIAYDGFIIVIGALGDRRFQVPSCVRCGELLVRLADGRLKPWLEWMESREPLHETMHLSST